MPASGGRSIVGFSDGDWLSVIDVVFDGLNAHWAGKDKLTTGHMR